MVFLYFTIFLNFLIMLNTLTCCRLFLTIKQNIGRPYVEFMLV